MSAANFVLALAIVYLLWSLTIRLGLKKLSCGRSFSRNTFFEGESGELVEVVRNDTWFIMPWLRVESRISPYIRLGRQDNLQVSGEMYYCSFFTLMPHQQIRRRHKVTFLKRGYYDLGNAALSSGDILGSFEYSHSQKLSTPVTVYPRLLDPGELPVPLSQFLDEVVRRQQLQQDPFLVRGIRAYHPGDPVRDIHWPATARMGEAQVRLHDYSARNKLLVVLNVQYQDLQLNNYIPDNESGPIEEGIRLAASLCVHALRSGMSAGIAANMPLMGQEGCTVMLPAEGSAREEEILSLCARLNLHCAQLFPSFLDSLTSENGLNILILSRYDSQSIRDGIRALEAAGNQVSLHLMEGGRNG